MRVYSHLYTLIFVPIHVCVHFIKTQVNCPSGILLQTYIVHIVINTNCTRPVANINSNFRIIFEDEEERGEWISEVDRPPHENIVKGLCTPLPIPVPVPAPAPAPAPGSGSGSAPAPAPTSASAICTRFLMQCRLHRRVRYRSGSRVKLHTKPRFLLVQNLWFVLYLSSASHYPPVASPQE